MLVDQQGRYWVRRVKMCITRYRIITPVGDEQDKFYEQKYLLNVPISFDDDILGDRPQSRGCSFAYKLVSLMNMLMLCPVSLSRGFHVDSLRELARLYTEHGFITADEADCDSHYK